jgi:hypothetical protein
MISLVLSGVFSIFFLDKEIKQRLLLHHLENENAYTSFMSMYYLVSLTINKNAKYEIYNAIEYS